MTPGYLYLISVLIAFSKFLSVLLAPLLNRMLLESTSTPRFGKEDRTMSNVFANHQSHCKACAYMCKFLGFVDKEHCSKSIEKYKNKKG